MKKKQLIISVGREFGSGGHEIAQGLADHYGLTMYDHDLLKEIAAKKNLNGDELTAYDEVKWNRFLYRTVRGLNSSPEQNVANLQFEYLREKAKAGDSFVVVGRCSETILKDYPGLISIFILGNMEHKVARVARLYGKTDKEAERFIREKDRKRKKYHDSHCNTKWSEPHTYDLSLNSSTLGVEGSFEFLSDYIDKRISRMK